MKSSDISKVGQLVYVVNPSDRNGVSGEEEYGTITKIGKKFFYVSWKHMELKFSIADLQYQSHIYSSAEEYRVENRRQKLMHKIGSQSSFSLRNVSLENLEKACELLGIEIF